MHLEDRRGERKIFQLQLTLIGQLLWDSPVRIDSYVVAAQKGTAQMAIITSSIGLIHRHHNQAALGGLNVLGGAVLDLVAA